MDPSSCHIPGMGATSDMWLFELKIIKISSPVTLATFQVLSSSMRLVATILDFTLSQKALLNMLF